MYTVLNAEIKVFMVRNYIFIALIIFITNTPFNQGSIILDSFGASWPLKRIALCYPSDPTIHC